MAETVKYIEIGGVRKPIEDSTARAATADSGWYDMVLLNGVTAGYPAPQYRKIGNIVSFRGAIIFNSVGVIQFTNLPVGFRPSKELHTLMLFSTGGTKQGRAANLFAAGDMWAVEELAGSTISDAVPYSLNNISFIADA